MTTLPDPLVPSNIDLRNFPDLPLEVATLRDSDLRRHSTGDEFKAALVLWCAAWHQVPAGSLPDNDVDLADMATIGSGKAAVRAWRKLRSMALRGWVKCSDGRLYHPRMAEKAIMAWRAKQSQRERTMKARLASLDKQINDCKDEVLKQKLKRDREALAEDLRQHLLGPLSQGQSHDPVTGSATESKGSDRIGSDLNGTTGGEPPAAAAAGPVAPPKGPPEPFEVRCYPPDATRAKGSPGLDGPAIPAAAAAAATATAATNDKLRALLGKSGLPATPQATAEWEGLLRKHGIRKQTDASSLLAWCARRGDCAYARLVTDAKLAEWRKESA